VTVVVKFGTSLLVGPRGSVRRTVLRRRAAEIAAIVNGGEPVAVVSSGAIALGLPHLGLERRPRALSKLQAASALGQARLQQTWERALAREGVHAAQILLTAADVADRAAYVNARNALTALFALGAVPIVNENDATATDEIAFGDNDALAAHVAILVRARLLVLLTEVDGVYTRAPGLPDAKPVREGAAVNDVTFGDASVLGRGGMQSKIVAARMASEAGIPTVIADGTLREVLGPILGGEPRGTRFDGTERELSAYKLWLRFAREPVGTLHVDEGARRAVGIEGRSLLAVGVARCDGTFDAGAAVELVGPDGVPFARGVTSASAAEIAERPSGLEAVHRDRLVVY
jgi:glutamate 5-kinase